MHRGTDWPLYEFATEREVAEYVGSKNASEAFYR